MSLQLLTSMYNLSVARCIGASPTIRPSCTIDTSQVQLTRYVDFCTNRVVGNHPNLAFYAWRLQATRQCVVTMVMPSLDSDAPLRMSSSHFEMSVFTPHELVRSIHQLEHKLRYDVVILSVSNLQKFQDVCTSLAPFLHSDSIIVIESTGFVALEPFVISSYAKSKQVTVCSIMNESDVKRFPNSNNFAHSVLNSDQRIYLGTCTDDSKALYKVSDSVTYGRFYKLLQLLQEQSGGCVSLLRSNNHREFMTYQWKLALPRIVLNPLSVIFEEPYPAELDKQILAKPLICGLVNEIFKIIKKMECKLIKGFENEANILKNWQAHYPVADCGDEPEYARSNSVLYGFFHQIDVDIDLLLLQPILLGDDYGVRTPYLENLYSIVCQLSKINSGQSIFFSRKSTKPFESHTTEISDLSQSLTTLKVERENVESQYKERQARMQSLETTLQQRQQAYNALSSKFEEQTRLFEKKLNELEQAKAKRESTLSELDAHVYQKQQVLSNLEARISYAEAFLSQKQLKIDTESKHTSSQEINGASEQPLANGTGHSDPSQNATTDIQDSMNKTFNLQQIMTPDLSEYTDVAVYGAALNGDIPPPPAQVPENATRQGVSHKQSLRDTSLFEKEQELQRRELALLARERELANSSQTGVNQSDPYYDPQTGDQFYDSPSGYPVQHVGQVANNGPHATMYNTSGQKYRSAHSLAGGNAYNGQQYDPNGYDQRPVQGLLPNGFPPNGAPPAHRNPQRYQQNGPQYGQQIPPQRPHMTSHNSVPSVMNPQGSQQHIQQNIPPHSYQARSNSMAFNSQHQTGQGNQMYQMQQMNPNSGPQINKMGLQASMSQQQFQSGYSAKKGSRRSALPDQVLNFDYGGRGGMPMPTATGGKPKSMAMGGSIMQQSVSLNQSKKPISGSNQGHLRLPKAPSSNSDSVYSHGSFGEDSSKPSTPDSQKDMRIDAPMTENVGKPLGAIATPPDEKKKRGFLKKH